MFDNPKKLVTNAAVGGSLSEKLFGHFFFARNWLYMNCYDAFDTSRVMGAAFFEGEISPLNIVHRPITVTDLRNHRDRVI